MEYKKMPDEAKEELGTMMEDFRQRVGDKAFAELMDITRRLKKLKAEYGREPQPDGPEPKETDDGFLIELSQLFFDALSEDPSIKGRPLDEPIDQETARAAVQRTITRLRTEGKITSEEMAAALPSIAARRVKKIDFPVDKLNANIWKLLERDMGGQIAIAAESSRDRGKKQLTTYYSIDFSELDKDVTITRKLEPYDKRVYIAIGALWAAGNTTITIGQIFYAMGGTGQPTRYQLDKIDEAVTKMTAARIYIDNTEEAKAYKYDKFTYNASLLPMERISAVINGKTVESAIHIFREPPLISFARGRKQITQIDRQLLTTPLNWTNQNLMLEDYLLECIAHAKRGTRSKKMLYNTIFTEARITEKKQRQRTPEKVRAILDYYQKCGHIKGYSAEKDGILLDL